MIVDTSENNYFYSQQAKDAFVNDRMDFATVPLTFRLTGYDKIYERVNEYSAHVTHGTNPYDLIEIVDIVQILHVSKSNICVLD